MSGYAHSIATRAYVYTVIDRLTLADSYIELMVWLNKHGYFARPDKLAAWRYMNHETGELTCGDLKQLIKIIGNYLNYTQSDIELLAARLFWDTYRYESFEITDANLAKWKKRAVITTDLNTNELLRAYETARKFPPNPLDSGYKNQAVMETYFHELLRRTENEMYQDPCPSQLVEKLDELGQTVIDFESTAQ